MKSRKNLVWAFVFFAAAAVLGSSFSAFSRVSAPVRNFEFTYVTKIPVLPADAKTSRIWIPLPQSNVSQAISGMKIESPFPFATRRDSKGKGDSIFMPLIAWDTFDCGSGIQIREVFASAGKTGILVT